MSYLLASIALLLPTYLVRFDVAGIPSTLLEVLIWIVFVIGIVQSFQDRSIWERLQARKVWLLPAGLIAFGALFGLLVAPDLRAALGLFKGFILEPVLVYVLALAFLKTRDDMRILGWGLFGGAALVALWSLFDAGGIDTGGRVIGPYTADTNASPNYLAFALAPLLPLAVWVGSRRGHLRGEWPVSSEVKEAAQYNKTKNPPQSPFAKGEGTVPLFRKEGLGEIFVVLITSILIIFGLHASDSRAGVVAGLGGLMIAIILGSRLVTSHYKLVTRGLVAGLLIICALSWLAVKPNFTLTPQEGGRITASNNVRWQLWSATGELAQQHWLLGTGLGGFQQRFDELTHDRVNYPEFITPRARTPHNLLVGMWMETGLLGLAGMFMIFVLVGRTIFRAVRNPDTQIIAASLIGAWFALLAHGLVDQPIWKNDTMVMFWLLVALSVSLATNTTTKAQAIKSDSN